jgi:hypothetical protein
MAGLGMRAAALVGGALLAAACEPPPRFVAVDGHPGKRGVDGGTDGGPPPPGPVATLTVTVEGSGRVVSSFFDCSSTCTVVVPSGAALEIHAEGSPGFALTGWSGACAGATACRVEVAGDAWVGAIFAAAAR